MNSKTQAVDIETQNMELETMFSILTLAFNNTDVIESIVDFSSMGRCFSVETAKKGAFEKHNFSHVPRIFNSRIFFGAPYYIDKNGDQITPLEHLLKIEDQMIDVIAAARDAAEVQA
jgi:hypothetical protein